MKTPKSPRPASSELSPTARKILEAAIQLLRTEGELSMRKLAVAAGVANMTPYNLFKSKHGLLAALSRADLARGVVRIEAPEDGDALDRMLRGLDVGFESLNRDTRYYRALYGAAYAGGDPSLIAVFQEPRIRYWRSALNQCARDDFLTATTRADLITTFLMDLYTGAIRRWIGESISTIQLYAEVNFGLMLLLLPHATDRARSRLQERLTRWEALLPPP